MSAELSWIVTIVGLAGFWLAGNKVWWAWYINIANQLLWVAFALVSGYYAFLLGTAFYLAVFIKNAYQWTKDEIARRDQIFEEELAKQPPLSLDMNLDGPPAPKLVGQRLEYVYDDDGKLAGERMEYVFEDLEVEVDTGYLEKT